MSRILTFEVIGSLILSYSSCKDDSQWHPWFFCVINNVEEIVIFLGLKVFYSDNSYLFFRSRNTQVIFVENPELRVPL